MTDYVQGLFVIVNTMISLYILVYVIIFLKRTRELPNLERRPWHLLVAGAAFFMLSQLVSFISLYLGDLLFGLSVSHIKLVLEFFYGGCVLLAFITQSHLILMKDVIVIMRRLKNQKKESELEKDINKDIREVSKKFYK
ncbi:MAG: hypothetical protein KJ583_05690 [Nanoarchaeota archaeon]|nr:hypothetical protein [Nanoarchaeota archaeon]MBU1269377.1 hypothetical protein [Nanoarchaeota archaeon]MBU1604782.1 hypothetical protein [Nanoarchaeota archaeon]MBU2442691.1 hypothetical protein [Nanoarchaeota archaeon]